MSKARWLARGAMERFNGGIPTASGVILSAAIFRRRLIWLSIQPAHKSPNYNGANRQPLFRSSPFLARLAFAVSFHTSATERRYLSFSMILTVTGPFWTRPRRWVAGLASPGRLRELGGVHTVKPYLELASVLPA